MDVNSAAPYANIVSALVALAAFVPTVISYYRHWNSSLRRVLGVLFCLSLGVAMGTSFAPRSSSPRAPPRTTDDGAQSNPHPSDAALQVERLAREGAEKRLAEENATRVEAERQAKGERVSRVAAERKASELESELSEAVKSRGGAEARVTNLSALLQGEKTRTGELEQQLRDARSKIRDSLPPPPPPRDGFIRAYFYDEPRGWNRIDWSALQRMRREHSGP